jgi:hypothetical protein
MKITITSIVFILNLFRYCNRLTKCKEIIELLLVQCDM